MARLTVHLTAAESCMALIVLKRSMKTFLSSFPASFFSLPALSGELKILTV